MLSISQEEIKTRVIIGSSEVSAIFLTSKKKIRRSLSQENWNCALMAKSFVLVTLFPAESRASYNLALFHKLLIAASLGLMLKKKT